MKKSFLAYLAVAFLGCGGGAQEKDVLCLALEVSPNKLDPAYVVDVAEGEVASLIFQGLVRFSPDGEVIPDLASSWEISDDGKRYVFHLDRRMRFSTGRRVGASDVAFSFKRLLSPDCRSPRKWVLERIKGADAFSEGMAPEIEGLAVLDDSTVSIELEGPFRPFLQLLAMPAARIVPEELFVDTKAHSGAPAALVSNFSEKPVGSGPWVLDSWERGDHLMLVPNPFHPAGSQTLRAIRYRIIPEAFTRIAEYESGSLDVLKIPSAELPRFLGNPSLSRRIQSVPELRVLYVGLNNTRKPLDDPCVRKALNMAVDVERIIEVLANGEAVRAAGAIPPSLKGYRKRPAYSYDPGASRKLLLEAGLGDGMELDIWQRDSPEGNRILEAIQGYLSEVGIQVRLVKREWSAFKEAVSKGKVDAFFLDWYADYPDAENFLYPLFHSENTGGGGNRSFFSSAEIDSLIELAHRTLGENECYNLYAKIDSLVYEEAPWIYLYFPKSFEVVSLGITGYRIPFLYLARQYEGVRKS
ncbi:MAG: hypothetical protein GTO42_01950 [Candidatus Latescibacteria bacterium]|nr:hypothetical protein [Candidatus Latescibacterota bacterium]NIO27294.1 hypothetical protein [Candidatus Latescibacterota bacterium]NIO54818.1 hypothetical protein [Candidatus Latescibacterota bacterium]NIT00901.1 hypothetical protein [Candidatus Latescibacterota bacterium]NIT37824.1 hypothetical protein [Candidatus Latescibacterota bacterium]